VTAYRSRHFSLSNPEGPTSAQLPLLLRRLADEIEAEGIDGDDMLDLVFSNDQVTEYGGWWRATLYWSPDDDTSDTSTRHEH
jgi:hypothetical protein